MRANGLAAWSLGLALLAGAGGLGLPGGAAAQEPATPAAGAAQPLPTAAPTLPPAPTPIPVATPLPADPAAAAQTDVVTLVAWYANDPSGEFLNVVPLAVDPAGVAGPGAGSAVGRAEFPDEGVPSVQFGDTRFDSYARSEGDIPERWTWLDDAEGARPATLVLQVAGTGGAYEGFFGTATFVSRDDGAGGVLILALRPPSPAGAADAAAAEGDAGAAATDATGAGADAAAAEPDPAIEPPTEEVAEPDPAVEPPTDVAAEPAG